MPEVKSYTKESIENAANKGDFAFLTQAAYFAEQNDVTDLKKSHKSLVYIMVRKLQPDTNHFGLEKFKSYLPVNFQKTHRLNIIPTLGIPAQLFYLAKQQNAEIEAKLEATAKEINEKYPYDLPTLRANAEKEKVAKETQDFSRHSFGSDYSEKSNNTIPTDTSSQTAGSPTHLASAERKFSTPEPVRERTDSQSSFVSVVATEEMVDPAFYHKDLVLPAHLDCTTRKAPEKAQQQQQQQQQQLPMTSSTTDAGTKGPLFRKLTKPEVEEHNRKLKARDNILAGGDRREQSKIRKEQKERSKN